MREQQFASFRLDDHLFGINILLVREIIRNVEFTPVEHAASGIRGMLNLRGQIITVLDLSTVLGLEPRVVDKNSHCIILKTTDESTRVMGADEIDDNIGNEVIGILVDDIADVLSIDDEDLESAPANAKGIDGENLQGVAKLDGKLLLILKMRKVMSHWMGRSQSGMLSSMKETSV
ncbi:MAG: hypothetical protein GY835_27010 [bacterium]|nr:hypothetical protein [bacterium]